MSEILELIITACGASAVTGIFALIATRKRKDTATQAGVQALLYLQIKSLGNACIKQGSIRTEDLEDIMRLHGIYHDDLRGNGYLDALIRNVQKLPINNNHSA